MFVLNSTVARVSLQCFKAERGKPQRRVPVGRETKAVPIPDKPRITRMPAGGPALGDLLPLSSRARIWGAKSSRHKKARNKGVGNALSLHPSGSNGLSKTNVHREATGASLGMVLCRCHLPVPRT